MKDNPSYYVLSPKGTHYLYISMYTIEASGTGLELPSFKVDFVLVSISVFTRG